ncbi:hypothetical protein [Micromonospora peucetia]|uniref:Uncharacterized protein n=1 Tax=Micromonospora peucetia TaxID=47871 RepID=A0ABZ1EBV7_9ACTN|nr:hypothetical protein [Micromonospora peucetia]WSA31076.1 hypothetical protein OIE14_23395 [Micromonospora peucetia]
MSPTQAVTTPGPLVHLARSPGSAVVSVHIGGAMGQILTARIETLLDLP